MHTLTQSIFSKLFKLGVLTIALLASPLRQQKNKSLQHLEAHHDFSISLFIVQKEKRELEHCGCAASSHLQCRWRVWPPFPVCASSLQAHGERKQSLNLTESQKQHKHFQDAEIFFKAQTHFAYWQEIQPSLNLSNNALININHAALGAVSPLHECANLREFCTLVTEIIKPRKWFRTQVQWIFNFLV